RRQAPPGEKNGRELELAELSEPAEQMGYLGLGSRPLIASDDVSNPHASGPPHVAPRARQHRTLNDSCLRHRIVKNAVPRAPNHLLDPPESGKPQRIPQPRRHSTPTSVPE